MALQTIRTLPSPTRSTSPSTHIINTLSRSTSVVSTSPPITPASPTSTFPPQNTISSAPPLIPSIHPSPPGNTRSVAIGLAVGLAIGIPTLLLALTLAVRKLQRKYAEQPDGQSNLYEIEVTSPKAELGNGYGIDATTSTEPGTEVDASVR
ncbi:hypothetical protein MMC14_009687 [Varicellaria rhodocarpa]|nr:hypothetical protein [Varicellaria rhodocarpa]